METVEYRVVRACTVKEEVFIVRRILPHGIEFEVARYSSEVIANMTASAMNAAAPLEV